MPFLAELGMQAAGQTAGNIVNEGMGLLTQPLKNKQQLKQAGRLQELQIKGSKELTDYNTAKQLEMWKATSYPGQVAMMKEAGINPALLYGMGGAGGATANINTGNVQGQSAGTAQASRGAEGMGMQMALIQAQKENIEADTRLKNVDANKKEGVDSQVGLATIESIKQATKNAKVQEEILKFEQALKKIDVNVAQQTEGDRMAQIVVMAEAAASTAEMLERDNTIAAETRDAKVMEIKALALNAVLRNELTAAQIKKTDAEINEIAQSIAQKWQGLDLEGRKTLIYERVGKFQSTQSQRTYDNIIKGVNTVMNTFKPISVTTN